MVLRFGKQTHLAKRPSSLVRVDVAVGELHVAVLDVEAGALPGGMVLAFGRFKESASIGAMAGSRVWWRAREFGHVLTELVASFE